ncbi:PAP/OAS1 substrate-binding domain superfamily [Euphorbia peplus]|nr:PAP/OAS1 substrate-binding domain superfamily [Euphorbia peplus]
MGDVRPYSPESNGEERPSSSSSSSSDLTAINWQRAETLAQRIIAQVQPTLVSQQRRKAVIDYVQRLIKNTLGCEVFPFGSVPLRTYLPDGDIDLTAFGGVNVEEALASDVCSVLEREDQNRNADFVVKDVQLIRAEVKLVKCLVQNIVVDISFNQLGGLCTLCFLEQVDHVIGKDNLFKRSIILIKAWCYYESRILGAHHGLISTYALETLVLYVFNVFHSSLNGPLAVLYKFLDYFSKFDWENYCISLSGPVQISSLPEVVVEAPENGGCDVLLSNDFLRDSAEMFSVSAKGFEANSRTFPLKHLNIVDPLKENNNLGRSVSKGNFYRIRSAFTYGARKLGRILSMPEESITEELFKFFSNTLDRHGSGQRPDVQDPATIDEQHDFGSRFPISGAELSKEDQRIYESEYCGQPLGVENVQVSMRKMNFNNRPAVPEYRVSGDAKDLATSGMHGLSISNGAIKSSSPGVAEGISPTGKAHLHYSGSAMENGEMRDGNLEWKCEEDSGFMEKKISSEVVSNGLDLSPVGSSNNPMLWSSEELYHGNSSNGASVRAAGSPENSNSLADLSGDCENHLNNLHHGRWWYEYAFSASAPSMSSSQMPPHFHGKNPWDLVRNSVQFRRNGISQMNVNGVVPPPFFYPMNAPLLTGAAFGMEEMHKPRGTGTYFPNTNHYRDRIYAGRGRNQGGVRSPRPNGRMVPSQETNLPDRNYRDHEHPHPHVQFHIHQNSGTFVPLELRQNGSIEARHYPNVNGFMHLPERVVEFESGSHLPATSSTDGGWHSDPGSAPTHNSSTTQAVPVQGPKPVVSVDHNRNSMKSYQLKDEDDFPPLSDSSGKGSSMGSVTKLEKPEQ